MFRSVLFLLIISSLEIFGLPEYIENLEEDLAKLPERYRPLAENYLSKRAAGTPGSTDHFCCTNWQLINNDEIQTKTQTLLVPKTRSVVVGYADCHGNTNPTRDPIPSTTRRSVTFTRVTPSSGSSSTEPFTICNWTPIYQTQSYTDLIAETITYLVPNSYNYCAPSDYVCCSGFVLLNKQCVHESAIPDLEYLIQLGLIGGIGKK